MVDAGAWVAIGYAQSAIREVLADYDETGRMGEHQAQALRDALKRLGAATS